MCQRQDEWSYLLILIEAIPKHGSPDMLVSDSGSIFVSKQAKFIYARLHIQKEQRISGENQRFGGPLHRHREAL